MSFKRLMVLLASVIAIALITIGGIAFASMDRLNSFQRGASADAIFYNQALNDVRQSQVDFQRQIQEWKNILIRGNDAELYKRYFESFVTYETRVQRSMKDVQTRLRAKSVSMPEIEQLIVEHEKLGAKYREALASWNGADPESGKIVDKLLRGIDRPASAAMDKAAKQIEDLAVKKLEVTSVDAESFAGQVKGIFLACAVVLLAISLFLCHRISRIVLGKVGVEPAELEEMFSKVSKGDFTASVTIKEDDRSSVAAQAQMMVFRVRSMLRAVKNNAGEVMESADAVQMGSDPARVQAALRSAKLGVNGLQSSLNRFRV